MKDFLNFIKGKNWLLLVIAVLCFVFIGVDFTYFNEMLYSLIKVGVMFVAAGAFRNLFFKKTINKYVSEGQLEKDFHGQLKEEGEEVSAEELQIRATQAAERLKTYRLFTAVSIAAVALILALI